MKRVEGLGIRAQGLGFSVRPLSLRCRIQGLGFRALGSRLTFGGFRVWKALLGGAEKPRYS